MGNFGLDEQSHLLNLKKPKIPAQMLLQTTMYYFTKFANKLVKNIQHQLPKQFVNFILNGHLIQYVNFRKGSVTLSLWELLL